MNDLRYTDKQKHIDKMSAVIGLVIYIIISLALAKEVRALDTSVHNEWYRNFSVMCIVQLLIHLVFMRIYRIRLFSIAGMFVIFTYLYHYGCTFTIGILNNTNFEFYYFFSARSFEFKSFVGASDMSYVGILATFAGVLIYEVMTSGRIKKAGYNLTYENCLEMGKRILICTLPFKLYSDITKLIASFRGSYLDSYSVGTSGYVGMIGIFAIAGVVLLLIAFHSENRKVAARIYFVSVIYCVVNMMTGARGSWLIVILLLSYFAYKYKIFHLDLKRFILISVVGFLGITFLNTLKDVRGRQDKSFSVYVDQFVVELTEYNPIVTMIAELGNTIRTPYLCYDQMPHSKEFTNGKTYLQGLVSILPNITPRLRRINRQAIFDQNLANNRAIGGSFIAEAYYNFGNYFWIVTVFIGLMVAWFSRKTERCIESEQYLSLAYILPVLINVLWLPRDSIYGLVRPMVYGYLLVGLFVRLYVKK